MYKIVFVNVHVTTYKYNMKLEIFNAVENRQEVKNVKVFLCSSQKLPQSSRVLYIPT